ncbi:ABC-2 type transport system permease protein [Myxococcus fulvus]|uniref:ABC-2 type transport system permease protein n=1 Tax=Myxococcus fulvus TaxID=33 RepID=A0A511TI34_MYXFU|nr:ABC transporter permease [Myxococcus fulvus]GEN12868.1 transport permease protein [Myxococcus fulvus]SET87771.1 ABC-2 type transport system permease protein [Myxococcus fulvus]
MHPLMVQYRAVVVKEVRQTARDKRVMALLTLAPLMQLFLLGFAVNFDVRHVPTVVVDRDRTAESRDYTRSLLAGDTLDLKAEFPDERTAEAALERGEASVALIIPRDFQKDVLKGQGAQVQALVDGSDPTRSSVAGNAVAQFAVLRATQLASAQARRQGDLLPHALVELVPRVLYNPELATSVYVVPGIAAMLLLIVTTVIMAMGLSRERETGTLEQLQVTPLRPGILMAGKVTPFLLIGLVDVGLALCVGVWVFGVPLRGSLTLVTVATLFYLLSTLGVGLLIATVSRTQQQAFVGGFLFVLPAVLLSGVMSPVRAMPDWLAWVTYLNPVRYYVEVLRGVLLREAELPDLWLQLVLLALFGVVMMAVAARRFQKTSA